MATSAYAVPLLPGSISRRAFRLSQRRLLLFSVDGLLLFASGLISVLIWLSLVRHVEWGYFGPQLVWGVVLPLLCLALLGVLGGYDLRAAADVRDITHRLVSVSVGFSIVYLASYFVFATPAAWLPIFPVVVHLPRLIPVVFLVVAVPALLSWRLFYARVLTGSRFQRQLLIVGAGFAGRTLNQALLPIQGCGYRVVGFVDDDEGKVGQCSGGAFVLGTHRDLMDLVKKHAVGEIVLAISYGLTAGMYEAMLRCYERGLPITPMPLLYEQITGRVAVEHIGEHVYAAAPVQGQMPGWVAGAVLRLLDVFGASLGMLFLLALIPWIWLGNFFLSPGPLFYGQQRVGRDGRTFNIIKFRSMIPNAEEGSGAVWAAPDDPRVTAFGRFLRLTRLDEVPQFWNVLRGDMSLVGPRPERPEFIEELATEIPLYRNRHVIRPGVTGWAQVNYRYGNSVEDALIKLQYDLYYIRHQSLWLNLWICLKTIEVIVRFQGM